MEIVNDPTVVPFDCDLTLVDYCISNKPEKDLVKVGLVPGKEIFVFPIKDHIETLKNMKAGGCYILVWSGTGSRWAAHVIEKLGLTEYVDLVITKPKWYVDDVPAEEWMKRIYRYPPYERKK